MRFCFVGVLVEDFFSIQSRVSPSPNYPPVINIDPEHSQVLIVESSLSNPVWRGGG